METMLINGVESKFKIIDKIDLYEDGIGNVQLWDASYSNESEEQRIHTVTQLASIAYGRENATSPEALYKRLQELKHESLWEFIRDGEQPHKITNSMRRNMYMLTYSDIVNHKQNIACFRIKAPIFVARQFFRHRAFSYIEMSRRYTKDSKVPFEFWFPKDMKDSFFAKEQPNVWMEEYNNLVSIGLHTQVASRFLPQTTYTEWYCMMETEGAKNYFELRTSSHAQQEIRDLSFSMLELLYKNQYEFYKKVVPNDEIDSAIREKTKW